MKLARIAEKIESHTCVFLMWVVFLVLFAHILGRYVFRYPLYFAEEVSRYSFIWMIMIGASLALRRESHTRVEYFINYLPMKAKRILEILVRGAILFFLGFMVYEGFFLSLKTMTIPTAAMEWPWGVIYLAAPIGGLLMMLTGVGQIVQDICNFPRGPQAFKKEIP